MGRESSHGMDILSLVLKTGHLGDSAICKGFSEQALGGTGHEDKPTKFSCTCTCIVP